MLMKNTALNVLKNSIECGHSVFMTKIKIYCFYQEIDLE